MNELELFKDSGDGVEFVLEVMFRELEFCIFILLRVNVVGEFRFDIMIC